MMKTDRVFENSAEFEWAFICAMRHWLWAGKAKNEITPEDVVKFFEYCPNLPFESLPPGVAPSTEKRREEVETLLGWIEEYGLGGWEYLRGRTATLPDWYVEEHLAGLTPVALI